MARKIIVADQHEDYVNRLVAYIHEKYGEKYQIETFNDKYMLKARIDKEKCEILLLSPELYDASLYFKNVKLPVILLEDEEALTYPEKLKWRINKYTRITTLLSYLEKEYEEVEKNRPIIYGVYSPAGGVGKSTIAVAIAMTYARIGKRALYLNLEDIDGTDMFFEGASVQPEFGKGFVEKDQYDTLLKKTIKLDPKSNVMYLDREAFSVPDIYTEELPFILERIIDNNIANIIVVEFSCSNTLIDKALMNTIDYLALVSSSHTHSIYKLKKWLENNQIADNMKEKLKLVINQGKEINLSERMDVIGRIDKLYAASPFDLCEHIAQNQSLKLHGLV